MLEPISDERLAEIRDVYLDNHAVIGELLAEVKRCHAERNKLGRKAAKRLTKQMADRLRVRNIDIRNGMTALTLEEAQDLCATFVGAARALLDGAENYTELEFEAKVAESPERYVFTIQRVGKLTPHEARMKAEAERGALAAELESMRVWAEAVGGQAEHAIDLLEVLVGPTCGGTHHDSCDHPGWPAVRTDMPCPHALARAFLAGARQSSAEVLHD